MITQTEREYILNSMKKLLDEYDYNYTLYALNKIIDEWSENKKTLIEAFKRHPNYVDGKFLIAFSEDYSRDFDPTAVKSFKQWLIDNCVTCMIDTLPDDINKQRIEDYCAFLPDKLYNFLNHLHERITTQTISAELAEYLKEIIPQIHPHAGQKTSRVINKICNYLNYDKHPDYNKEFAKFADGLNPITIRRHTVLSINPLDYLTMSFGNSWASCHTIDKENKRRMPNSYEGQYSSGTISYMLDPSSMVFYTVDNKYDGDDYWTQPKINRQMFHYGEDKLVQGRLYPQCNDGYGESYTPYRNIVQNIMSIILGVPNLWNLRKGIDAASEYIVSRGTHYADYESFSDCTLSVIRDSSNEKEFYVGSKPICISCGNYHGYTENINCCVRKKTCSCCGKSIDIEDGFWVNEEFYCDDCVTYCDECGCYELNENVVYVESTNRNVCEDCLENLYTYCDSCGKYHRDYNLRYIENLNMAICKDCLENNYAKCDHCGDYFELDDIEETDDGNYCKDCYAEVCDDVSQNM